MGLALIPEGSSASEPEVWQGAHIPAQAKTRAASKCCLYGSWWMCKAGPSRQLAGFPHVCIPELTLALDELWHPKALGSSSGPRSIPELGCVPTAPHSSSLRAGGPQ